MMLPPETPHSGGSPWMGLLITASILSCCLQPTSAQEASVTVVPSPPYGTVGDNVTLNIQGFSGPVGSYTWYRKAVANSNLIAAYFVISGEQKPNDTRERVLPNGSLYIPNLALNDTDLYVVVIAPPADIQKTAVGQLRVYGILSKPTISSTNMAPVEYDSVTLTCESESQDLTYLWRNQSSTVGYNRTLTISNVTREDKGPYECKIENPISSNTSDPFTLNITYGPDTPKIVPTAPKYHVGADLELTCFADSNPPAQYIWLNNGNQLSTTNKLSIHNVLLNHTGIYTCNASNPNTHLYRTKEVNVTIYEKLTKPNITVNISSTSIVENASLVLTCSTQDEGTDIRWFFNNKTLLPNERINMSTDNQTLTITVVKRVDVGSYQCEVYNPISTYRSDPVILTVNYGPDNLKILCCENGETEVRFNDPLTLKCLAESYPPAQYQWFVNSSSSPKHFGSIYDISHVSWEHSGKYTCQAKNTVTNATISKDIIVKVVGENSLSAGAIAGIVIGVLAGVALIGALIYFLVIRKTGGGSGHHHTGHKTSASNHSQALSDSSPNGNEEVSYASVNFNAQRPPSMAQSPKPTDTIYSEIKKN